MLRPAPVKTMKRFPDWSNALTSLAQLTALSGRAMVLSPFQKAEQYFFNL
jgi:hypothetical protein